MDAIPDVTTIQVQDIWLRAFSFRDRAVCYVFPERSRLGIPRVGSALYFWDKEFICMVTIVFKIP